MLVSTPRASLLPSSSVSLPCFSWPLPRESLSLSLSLSLSRNGGPLHYHGFERSVALMDTAVASGVLCNVLRFR